MVTLLEGGAYLLNGTEIIPDNQEAATAVAAKTGKQMNKELQQDFEKLAKDFETHKVDSQRTEILDFANSAMNRRKHTKEEFDHIIKVHDDYLQYVRERNLENGQVKLAYEYIEKIYQRCLEKNSFLVVREDEETED